MCNFPNFGIPSYIWLPNEDIVVSRKKAENARINDLYRLLESTAQHGQHINRHAELHIMLLLYQVQHLHGAQQSKMQLAEARLIFDRLNLRLLDH